MAEIISTILDCIFGILIALMGLVIFVVPYDKYQEIFPNSPPKMVIKVLAVVTILCGIFTTIIMIMGSL